MSLLKTAIFLFGMKMTPSNIRDFASSYFLIKENPKPIKRCKSQRKKKRHPLNFVSLG